MLWIKKAHYTGNYNIHLTFNNGKEGTVNLKETIFADERTIFSKLKNESNFKNFKIDHHTIIWSNELDLAPEYLFYLTFKSDPKLQDQFKQWGYIK
ncbi:DUF2442 domain-containing protein [bacterium]|nr:DUF2442 domain-containing protein [bacterium]